MASVTSMWSGGVTPTTGTVAAKIDTPGASCRAKVGVSSSLTGAVFSAAVIADAQGYVQLPVTGLVASTAYNYAVEIGGVVDAKRGQFTTFPTAGSPASFTFATASCAQTGSTHKVFTAIKNRAPLFFLHDGDLHYEGIATNNASLYRAAYDSVLASTTQGPLYQAVPIAYMWDDHDFGPDNSDRTAAGTPAAQATYRQVVPSYPLGDTAGIWQSFQVGRCWFIVTDLRSYRDPDTDTDSASKTMMGSTQKAWFKAQLLAAKAAGAVFIFWVSTSVWRVKLPLTGLDAADKDHWGAFTYERAELADYIKANAIPRVQILEGDMHALGADPYGTVSDFATGGGMPLPNFCAASLDATVLNTRTVNWPLGPVEGQGQYALVTVTDDGTHAPTFQWQGISVNASTGAETVLMSFTTPKTVARQAKVWNGSAWTPRQPKVYDGAAWTPRPGGVH